MPGSPAACLNHRKLMQTRPQWGHPPPIHYPPPSHSASSSSSHATHSQQQQRLVVVVAFANNYICLCFLCNRLCIVRHPHRCLLGGWLVGWLCPDQDRNGVESRPIVLRKGSRRPWRSLWEWMAVVVLVSATNKLLLLIFPAGK